MSKLAKNSKFYFKHYFVMLIKINDLNLLKYVLLLMVTKSILSNFWSCSCS